MKPGTDLHRRYFSVVGEPDEGKVGVGGIGFVVGLLGLDAAHQFTCRVRSRWCVYYSSNLLLSAIHVTYSTA